MKNKLLYILLCFNAFIYSCKKKYGFTSSGVEIITPTGNEKYLNQNSDSIFNQNNLPIIEINLPENALKYINSNPAAEEYVEGSLSYNGETISPIGIRYKGSIGAFVGGVSGNDWSNPSGHKTATKLSMKFKIDWKGYNTTFYNLKTLQLHSMNLDKSQLHDRLGYWLFREMGVPAPRSIHAKLYINGIYNGLFSMVEQIDEQFASFNFSDGSGNLYKEVWPLNSNGEVQSDKKLYQGLITNKIAGVNNHIIKQFAQNVINTTDDNTLLNTLNNHMNIDQTIALAVVDRAIRNDDGPFHWYCGLFGCEPHNFFWYENPSSNKVHLIPWDLDNAFENIISDVNPVTPIKDSWGDTSNNCQSFAYGDMGIEQKSAACDKIIGGLSKNMLKYQQLKDSLISGPMSQAIVDAKIDEWVNQIINATIEANQIHNDAISTSDWQNEIIELKNQLEYSRTH